LPQLIDFDMFDDVKVVLLLCHMPPISVVDQALRPLQLHIPGEPIHALEPRLGNPFSARKHVEGDSLLVIFQEQANGYHVILGPCVLWIHQWHVDKVVTPARQYHGRHAGWMTGIAFGLPWRSLDIPHAQEPACCQLDVVEVVTFLLH